MALGKDYAAQDCSLARALEVVGERWTLLIVRDAFYGVRRFSDFLVHLDIPRAVLSARLQSMVDAGVLVKDGHDYVLTDMGKDLWPAVHALARWAEAHLSAEPSRVFVHLACGTEIGPDGRCAACGRHVAPEELEIHAGPGVRHRTDPVSMVLRNPHRVLEPIRT
ncbi:winged helix-turn-helix transcriptional regulator [Actinomadura citrea]|uniref:DNA-binding HxlR family transcriptional regulator n=1 Tax=Actinomadura citrea TaxID=46158 RepID=A0A7Y9KCW2_9ACTN|nr:helix-turn-helix domain-containing protein [Actinomadura citrea]NYE14452.1 DNA-binding HxlR family transcriptional regulator [Actinomadura citrea]GGT78718.1 ArsR family transcriptional regulator [Actinomadura citrea]